MALPELVSMKTYSSLVPAYKILVFYFVVMFVTSTVGYTLDKKSGFTYGLYCGIVLSLVLWHMYGRKMFNLHLNQYPRNSLFESFLP